MEDEREMETGWKRKRCGINWSNKDAIFGPYQIQCDKCCQDVSTYICIKPRAINDGSRFGSS